MSAYIVRLKENHEAVGIFFAEGPYPLWDVVDECTSPSACEYARLDATRGGIMWPMNGAWVADRHDDEPGPNFDGAALTAGWSDRIISGVGILNWKTFPPFESALREAGDG